MDRFRNISSSTATAARSDSMLIASASKSRGRVSIAHNVPITAPDILSCAPA
jgi:hypothetical protein